MNKISRRALLEMTKIVIGAVDGRGLVYQEIVEGLSQAIGIKRCVVFRVFLNSNNEKWCGIVAGTPPREHGIGIREPLKMHPDIKTVAEKKEILLITNPREDPLTSYFRWIVECKDINQILYIPLILNHNFKKTVVVIVVEVTGEKKKFSRDEIEFCTEVGEIVSLILNHEEASIMQTRHEIINRIVSLGGFARRLKTLTKEFSDKTRIIVQEVEAVEKMLPQESKNF